MEERMDLLENEIGIFRELPTPYQKASYFWSILRSELEICGSFLNDEESKNFRTYNRYHSKIQDVKPSRLLYYQDRYSQGVQHLIRHLEPNTKVLDAGCGVGSESLLCSILMADVIGVDLSSDRLAIANKRINFYQKHVGRPINIQFYAQSVFDLADNLFQIIWVKNAISHIEPAGKFISLCHQHLELGGRLVLCDQNFLNPREYYKAKKAQLRGGGTYTTKLDPSTNVEVPYARERLFSVSSISNMLVTNGFRIETLHMYGFCPYLAFSYRDKPLAYYIDRIVDHIPKVKLLGAGYVIVAVKY